MPHHAGGTGHGHRPLDPVQQRFSDGSVAAWAARELRLRVFHIPEPRLSRNLNFAASQARAPLLAFVRRGWHNPDALPRPSMQYVEYRLVDGQLERSARGALDGAAQHVVGQRTHEAAALREGQEGRGREQLPLDRERRPRVPDRLPGAADLLGGFDQAVEVDPAGADLSAWALLRRTDGAYERLEGTGVALGACCRSSLMLT